MKNDPKRLTLLSGAVSGPQLTEASGWQHAVIVGDVGCRKTGKAVISITDAHCAEIVKGYKALGGRMQTPIDLDHAMALGEGEARRAYGRVADMEHRLGEGVFVKMALNKGGVKWVEDNAGCAFVSPSIRTDLYDPQKPGVLLAKTWMPALSLTATPRQAGVPEVVLSEAGQPSTILLASFEERAEVRAFEDALTFHAEAVLRSEGYAVGYLSLRDWSGDESGEVVVSWYDDGTDIRHVRQLQWSRGEAVEVTAPSVAVTERTVFEVDPLTAPLVSGRHRYLDHSDLSEHTDSIPPGDGHPREAQEDPMPAPDTRLDGLLSEVPEATRDKVSTLLAERDEQISALLSERDAAQTQVEELTGKVAEAEKQRDDFKGLAGDFSERLEAIETERKAEKAKAQAQARADFIEVALSESRIPADKAEYFGERFDADPEHTREMVNLVPAGTYGPPSTPPGFDGPGVELSEAEVKAKTSAAIKARAYQIQAEKKAAGEPIRFNDAWDLAEIEQQKGGN